MRNPIAVIPLTIHLSVCDTGLTAKRLELHFQRFTAFISIWLTQSRGNG